MIVNPSERLQLIAQRARKFMGKSASVVVFTHALGAISVGVSVLVEVAVLFVFHKTGLFPTVASVIVGSALILISLLHSGIKLTHLMMDFGDDLVVLCGQPVFYQRKGNHLVKRTIEDIVSELREH